MSKTMGNRSTANRNFVIAYILLVALPLLGLAGVLRSGRGLVAPISVDGVWKFGMDGAKLPTTGCGKSLASLQDSLVTISQSGKWLVLGLNNGPSAAGSGVIEGTTLNATIPLPDSSTSESGCGSNTMLALSATVTQKAEPRSMLGTISVNECPSCSNVKYQAIRQTGSSGSKAH
jgi:hypothetical protein